MTTTTKLTKRDDRFARLVADATEAPGFCYAKSRERDYKGFNDDFQAEKLLKNNDINQAVKALRKNKLISSATMGSYEPNGQRFLFRPTSRQRPRPDPNR